MEAELLIANDLVTVSEIALWKKMERQIERSRSLHQQKQLGRPWISSTPGTLCNQPPNRFSTKHFRRPAFRKIKFRNSISTRKVQLVDVLRSERTPSDYQNRFSELTNLADHLLQRSLEVGNLAHQLLESPNPALRLPHFAGVLPPVRRLHLVLLNRHFLKIQRFSFGAKHSNSDPKKRKIHEI